MKFKVKICSLAELYHKRNKRSYAHTGHYPNTICISKSLFKIPLTYRYAILMHEIGHLLSSIPTEESANKTVKELFGVNIRYDSKTPYGDRLQRIPIKDIQKVYGILTSFIVNSF